jgi:hypothetical protein
LKGDTSATPQVSPVKCHHKLKGPTRSVDYLAPLPARITYVSQPGSEQQEFLAMPTAAKKRVEDWRAD